MKEEDVAPSPIFSETQIAETFAKEHNGALRYVAKWGTWLRFDGKVWRDEETRAAFNLAKVICKDFAAKVNKSKDARTLASARTISAVERIAAAERALAATVDQWDIDRWLLNTPDGVVDLRTGKMRPHRAEDYMTKMTAVGPSETAKCPLWLAHLKTVTNNNNDLMAYLKRYFGYSLTGSVQEHALLFCHGDGGGGKGTTVNTFAYVLGDYAAVADMELFTYSKHDRHSTDIAALRGARFVTASETEQGRGWAEARIKQMTGGDKITARFMRQDNFTFMPQFKLCIQGNHKPHLRNIDNAIRRRFNIFPFTAKIPKDKIDLLLPDKLKEEAPGILRWAIDGCLEWQAKKLSPPDVIIKATNEYLEAEDTKMTWFQETFIIDKSSPGLFTQEMFESWKLYADRRGEFAGTAKALSTWLDENSEQLRIVKNKDLRKEVPASMGKGNQKVVKHAKGFMRVRFRTEEEGYERETMAEAM
jgi:putative DNA primase/helicase